MVVDNVVLEAVVVQWVDQNVKINYFCAVVFVGECVAAAVAPVRIDFVALARHCSDLYWPSWTVGRALTM